MALTPTDTHPFGRVLTAMVTPFAADGTVDLAGVSQLATDLVELGNDGLIVNGTTGESATTTDAEKDAILRAVVAAVGDRARVIAGAGSNDTAHSAELARAAQKAGAHGVLVVTPYYNKPPQAGLIAHFTTVAEASELPVMLYDIPGRAGVAIETETLLRLAEHPRILANKDAKGDLFAATQVMSTSGLAYYCGDDALNLPMLAVGAVGMVSVVGHLVADRLAALVAAYEAGEVARARELNFGLVPVVEAIMTRTQGVIATKAALDYLGRAGGGPLRAPLVPMPEADRVALVAGLAAGAVPGFAA